MDQRDHIATLCAAGTLGIAASGLALGVQAVQDTAYSSTPGKRKWPGASSSNVPPPRRVISQPLASTANTTEDRVQLSISTSFFRRQSRRDVRPPTTSESEAEGSRGSSLSRGGLFRPRTSDTRSTSGRRDPSAGSSWLKRVSMVSSQRASSPSATSSIQDSAQASPAPGTLDNKVSLPNKLVKRSTSQRGLSNDQARGTFMRRPATSHQRSVTLQEWTPRDISFSMPATPYLSSDTGPSWRPFFEQGYPRKRHTSSGTNDFAPLRTISPVTNGRPTLILGSQVETSDSLNDHTKSIFESPTELKPASTGKQRIIRSLSSVHRAARRRHFTDLTVKLTAEVANGTITSTSKRSPRSPLSMTSPFESELPQPSPSSNSSPALASVRRGFSFKKRQSLAPSDPTTASSDNDTRIFTDDDSMDFQSDTPYDSLTTRATAGSHSLSRAPKLDTIFNEPQATLSADDAMLPQLMQKTTLRDDTSGIYLSRQREQLRGIGISNIDEQSSDFDFAEEPTSALTPVKSGPGAYDDYNITPIPQRHRYFDSAITSSPPIAMAGFVDGAIRSPELVLRPRLAEEDADDIDWSPKSDRQEKTGTPISRGGNNICSSSVPLISEFQPVHSDSVNTDDQDGEGDKRLSSIFDWSENQKLGGDGTPGAIVRPKTVHGKQGHDNSRSRSSGRKGPPQVHLRSQSVPNSRDPNAEQTPNSTSKYGTWGLGHKGVSEEWSDDFEFDDVEEEDVPQIAMSALVPVQRRVSRGVKVPQAIIDRQASVRIQFSQVQEFMLLVEELKQLRARGAALNLLSSHTMQLWKDAESIIELATINNEEDDTLARPSSPTSSDIFGDEIAAIPRTGQDRDRDIMEENSRQPALLALRSVSSPATPPHGRPRGESLAQAKHFLHSIHQHRSGLDSSPLEMVSQPQKKLPFDTQDLKDLVVRSGVINRALKDIIRKAEGLSASPSKTPPQPRDPAFSQIFTAPDSSPCPPFRKPSLPKSRSANSYPFGTFGGKTSTISTSPPPMALVS